MKVRVPYLVMITLLLLLSCVGYDDPIDRLEELCEEIREQGQYYEEEDWVYAQKELQEIEKGIQELIEDDADAVSYSEALETVGKVYGLIASYRGQETQPECPVRRDPPKESKREKDSQIEDYTDIPQDWSKSEINKANTAGEADYLSMEEKKIYVLCNLARLDGNKFWRTFVVPYIGDRKNTYTESLRVDLNNVINLNMITPNKELCGSATYHAKDMGKTAKCGHYSSDGTPPNERISRWYKKWKTIGENCSYGRYDAASIVLALLIDEGVPDLGHRKNILSPEFGKMGVSIQTHGYYGINCVQDFAD